MSYDVLVFLPEAAPTDREAFLGWFLRVMRLQDGHMSSNPALAPPPLSDWYAQMTRAHPPFISHHAPEGADSDDPHGAEYRFSDVAVFARFQWEVSRKALHKAKRAAQAWEVGLFDISGDLAPVWMPVNGRFRVMHQGDRPDLSARVPLARV